MERPEKSSIWFAVVNVFAASETAATLWKDAEGLLKEKGVLFHGTRTGRAGNAAELTFDACMAGYRKFIAVGGDGTVHDVLNGIAAFLDWGVSSGRKLSFSDFSLAVIPFGSGNDWIKSLGLKADLNAAVDAIASGNLSKQDVVKVSLLAHDALPNEIELAVSYMVNVGGVGIDAKVCERVNAKKKEGKRGKILYVTSLIQAIAQRKSVPVRVVCDGKTIFGGPYYSIAFGVGKYSGGGMRQTPAAVLDDGLLDVTVIPELPFHRILCEAPKLFTDKFLTVPELAVAKSKKILVLPHDLTAPQPVEVDGEVVGNAPVRFEVLDSQLNIAVPPVE
jgi:YegS/Rv2252/BmrU family lipid kinase